MNFWGRRVMDPGRQYYFGAYCLDEQGPVLFRDHERVLLPPKVIELLLVLVQSAGRVLTREQLLRQLWPDVVVEDGSLTSHISQLRKALAADNVELIETVPKCGYRFIAPLEGAGSDTS
jgi:DNA-binding winged helix-turn-helix (wHTH) protein